MHGQSGVLSSPNHPGRYPPNTECVWDVNVQPGYHINLTFIPPFEMEVQDQCTGDYVDVGSIHFGIRVWFL